MGGKAQGSPAQYPGHESKQGSRSASAAWAPKLIGPIILLVLAVVGVARVRSPWIGPLSGVHGRIPELRGLLDCTSCHGTPGQSLGEACLGCHDDIRDEREGPRGFHGSLSTEQLESCDSCHREHFGASSSLVSEESFRGAGYAKRSEYDHAGLDFQLEGKHSTLECKRCHELADTKLLLKGQKRFLGNSQDCDTCHDNPHEGKLEDCASCHGQEKDFELVADFEHDDLFPLLGGHGDLACKRCHAKTDGSSVEDLVLRTKGHSLTSSELRDCSFCHDTPHRPAFLERSAALLGVSTEASCPDCHDYRKGLFSAGAEELPRDLHGATGFALIDGHQDVSCEKCHEGIGGAASASPEHKGGREGSFATRFPGRGPNACKSCHGKPHGNQFEGGPFQEKRCLDCHDRRDFHEPKLDWKSHDQTAFPLLGSHRDLDCLDCHERRPEDPEEGSIRFVGTPKNCEACHEYPHRGQFQKGPFSDEDCRRCHGFESFQPSRFDLPQHAKTSFPLKGAHEAVACKLCHEQEGQKALQFTGTSTICADCHEDPHGGAFDQAGMPQEIAGKKGCARCHEGALSFKDFSGSSFDHERWTLFALRGKHAEIECKSCHESKRSEDGKSILREAPDGDCAGCHEDPHAGQFREQGRVDCSRCHSDAWPFKVLVFDHQKDASFRLDKDHEKLDCAKCHKEYTLASGAKLVRFKDLGKECRDCHGDFVPKSKFPKLEPKHRIWRGRK